MIIIYVVCAIKVISLETSFKYKFDGILFVAYISYIIGITLMVKINLEIYISPYNLVGENTTPVLW